MREAIVMLKRITLITALALGASSAVAMASPEDTYQPRGEVYRGTDRTYDRTYTTWDRDRDQRWGHGNRADFGPRHYRASWVALSAPLRLGRMGRDAIAVADRNTFTQLRLQVARPVQSSGS